MLTTDHDECTWDLNKSIRSLTNKDKCLVDVAAYQWVTGRTGLTANPREIPLAANR